MKTLSKVALAAIVSLAAPTAAFSASTYDFTGPLGHGEHRSQSTFSYSGGPANLDVTGRACGADCSTGEDVKLQRWDNGFGIWDDSKSGYVHGAYNSAHMVDGYPRDEMVVLSFDRAVELSSLSFNYIYEETAKKGTTRWDDFRLWSFVDHAWQTVSGVIEIGADKLNDQNSIGSHVFDKPVVGQVFGVATTDRTDSWKLRSVSFDASEQPAPVPVPAAGLLLLGALGAMTALKRRKG